MDEQKLPKKRGRPPKLPEASKTAGEPCNGKDGCPLCTNVPNQPNELTEIREQVGRLTDLVTALGERVLNAPQTPVEAPVRLQEASTKPTSPTSDLSDIVPSAWRRIVDDMLGTDFDLKVEESSGGNMIIKILLPDSLDRRVGERTGKDCSTGLVRRSSDVADVEAWCLKIRSNIQKTHVGFRR